MQHSTQCASIIDDNRSAFCDESSDSSRQTSHETQKNQVRAAHTLPGQQFGYVCAPYTCETFPSLDLPFSLCLSLSLTRCLVVAFVLHSNEVESSAQSEQKVNMSQAEN